MLLGGFLSADYEKKPMYVITIWKLYRRMGDE